MRLSHIVCVVFASFLMMSPIRAEDAAPGKQVEVTLDLGDEQSISFLLYLPESYGDSQKWPLMLFLHGRGESNGPLSLVKKWGPPRLIDRGEQFPYVVASPQCPRDQSWSNDVEQAKLLKLLNHLMATYAVDTDRVYLTGLSMGGYGSWRLAVDHPQMFAAVAPICGKGDPAQAARLKNLPIWVFHGTEDRAVPFSHSEEMVAAIRAAGGELVRFTTLESIGHNSWSAAYATPELYTWFDRQRRNRETDAE